jgi:peptidyl-prolyl cis-trans isomerase B (cyclophilin B)
MKILALILLLPVFISFAPKEKRNTVEIVTSLGTIRIMLYNETPLHRDNFLKLVDEKFYDSLLFHRVISAFMIQGGDPESENAPEGKMLGNGDVGHTVPAEFLPSLFHKKGALAAARQGDNVNPQKASSGCQFYIVQGKKFTDAELDKIESKSGVKHTAEQREVYKTLGGTPHLDMNYTVFGEVLEGMSVVDAIAAVKTDNNDRPIQDVLILSVRKGKKMKLR